MECNGENKCKNRIGWKPATTRKEILQEMELISYYSEDFFPQTFFRQEKKKKKLQVNVETKSLDKFTLIVLKYTEFYMTICFSKGQYSFYLVEFPKLIL